MNDIKSVSNSSSEVATNKVNLAVNKVEFAGNNQFNSGQFGSIEELDSYIQKQIIKTNNGHQCSICGRISKRGSNLKEHIEIHIEGLSFSCDICGNNSGTRKRFRQHSCTA